MNAESRLLHKCREQIEQSLNWGDSTSWTKQDFENLSERIFEKTQVRLSASTLLRIWGKVRYDNSPTSSTLNALARFTGYETWRDFQHAHRDEQPAADTGTPVLKAPIRRITSLPLRIVSLAGIVIAGVVFILFMVNGKTPFDKRPNGIAFKARKVTDGLPNSVVFTYDIRGYKSDSVCIQQNWDPKRRERVSPTGHEHTSVYYRPGYFQAKLVVDNEIWLEDDVFIKSDGWVGIIDSEPAIYVSEAEKKQPLGLGITSALMKEKLGEKALTERSITFSNVREFDKLMGNAFTLDASLKNTTTVEETLCRRLTVTILTKGGALVVPLAAKGCISEIQVLAPDGWINGKDNDLSAFGCDFNDFEQLRCQVENKHFKVSLNGKLIMDRIQKEEVDEIIGIRIAFEGAGEISHIRLAGPDKVRYEEDFGQYNP